MKTLNEMSISELIEQVQDSLDGMGLEGFHELLSRLQGDAGQAEAIKAEREACIDAVKSVRSNWASGAYTVGQVIQEAVDAIRSRGAGSPLAGAVEPRKLEGEIKEGDRLLWWEPENPGYREHIVVTKIVKRGTDEARIWTKGPKGEHWNDESRIREACVRDEG